MEVHLCPEPSLTAFMFPFGVTLIIQCTFDKFSTLEMAGQSEIRSRLRLIVNQSIGMESNFVLHKNEAVR